MHTGLMLFGRAKRTSYILDGLNPARKAVLVKAMTAIPEIKVVSIDVPRCIITVESKRDPIESIRLAAGIAGTTVRVIV
jgi:hypothetical protein